METPIDEFSCASDSLYCELFLACPQQTEFEVWSLQCVLGDKGILPLGLRDFLKNNF